MSDTEGSQTKKTIDDREEAVLKFWKDNAIFEKSLQKNEEQNTYVFYDGPPFATGLPHYGHLLQGTIKDVIPRYQTMRGRYVRRQWGWDCHGLPIENLIEKELGLAQKKDIEEYGIEKFNQKARDSVLAYDAEWKNIVPRMGRWVDMENAYKTMDAPYTESIWWAFKTLYDKKFAYEGYKAMHICPRCETTLAASEVAQGYKDVKDISVYVKFELVDEPNTYLVAWTTTPWTLPGNVALAVGADIEYVKVCTQKPAQISSQKGIYVVHESEYLYMAKNILEKLEEIRPNVYWFPNGEYELKLILESKIFGRDLVGKSYKPLFDDYVGSDTLLNKENGWKVYAADFVTTETGTGIVHIAPAFGEDDMELGKKMKLPFIQHVAMNGTIKPEFSPFAGMSVKPKSDDDKVRLGTDIAILQYLKEKRVFFAKENITHSYPHCWRCETPLLNYAASSWFINVTALKPRLIAENKEISWIPEHFRDGRFGKWLEGARDWAVSRSRYWGAPIPVWKCNKCAHVDVLGSLEDLRKKTRSKNSYTVIRHGEAQTNVQGIVSYHIEDKYDLTDKGREQVKVAVSKLKKKNIDLIISSPIWRTRQTTEIIADALNLPTDAVLYDARIAEVNTGEFNKCDVGDYRAFFASTIEKFYKRPSGGETLEEMKKRIGEFLYDIDSRYEGRNILIVTHEYGAWLMNVVLRGANNEEAARMKDAAKEDYIANAEIRDLSFAPIPHDRSFTLDFHRPYIDQVTYHCSCELGMMERVSDVFDCWFESGSMPFSQFHFMGDESTPEGKIFSKNYPADFIAEAVDQTRGWFYNMLVLSVGLFDRAAFKSVITTGLILAEDGQKMSKRLKNYPDPMDVVHKYGADALRLYMLGSPVVRGEELCFSESGVDEMLKKIILRIDNVWSFYNTYSPGFVIARSAPERPYVLDQWIIARWKETHAEVTHYLDTHELDRAIRPITSFVDDFSTWYIRRSRERFKSEDDDDKRAAQETTGWTLLQLAKLIAPFAPFLAEDVYQKCAIEDKKESVHLEDWPKTEITTGLIIEEMDLVRQIVEITLAARAQSGIKVRQPLSDLVVVLDTKKHTLRDELLGIIKEEINVKSVVLSEKLPDEEERKKYITIESGGISMALCTAITPELLKEGQLRDLIRFIQEERKRTGCIPDEKIALAIAGGDRLRELVSLYENELKKAANITSITHTASGAGTEISLGDIKAAIIITKP